MKKEEIFMKKFLFAIAILLCGCQQSVSDPPVSVQEKSVDDLFKINDTTYLKTNDTTTGEFIGIKVAEITGKNQNKPIKNGKSTELEKGTIIYQIVNSEDLAVKLDGKWVVYRKE